VTPNRAVSQVTGRVAAGIVAGQGVAVLAAAAFLTVRGLGRDAADRTGAELGALLVGLAGAALVVAARGVWRHRRWARSPVVVLELLCLPVAWGLLQSGRPELGLPVGGLAVLALALLAVSGAGQPSGR
jgi:hypothetical protein